VIYIVWLEKKTPRWPVYNKKMIIVYIFEDEIETTYLQLV